MSLLGRDSIKPPDAVKRCPHVIEQVTARSAHLAHDVRRERYKQFVTNAAAFYRGTAGLFWKDFVQLGWGQFDLGKLGVESMLHGNSPLQRTSTWTWITGDQHLSNFGAWRNRHGDIVFGMNDFDEAMIYDFQMDIWRLATSVYGHALMNGLEEPQAAAAVLTLCDSYLSTVVSYVGNERALTYEVTEQTATGTLQAFLHNVSGAASQHHLLRKFTEVGSDGRRRLLRNSQTKLESVPRETEAEVKRALGGFEYGATMMKIGWHARLWDPEDNEGGDFEVLDVAARKGSGVGSYGVARYYVLLACRDSDGVDVYDDDQNGNRGGVLLDVKAEPAPAAVKVLSKIDKAWYETLFNNHAARAVYGQRSLSSYSDPFTGWAIINGSEHVVRQRSPWKTTFDLDQLRTYAEFTEFVSQVAVVTATSHTRGTAGQSPGQFKEIVASALGKSSARATWSMSVALIAAAYHEQVQLDFECFRDYYHERFGGKE